MLGKQTRRGDRGSGGPHPQNGWQILSSLLQKPHRAQHLQGNAVPPTNGAAQDVNEPQLCMQPMYNAP